MESASFIPVKYANLIVRYTHNLLSEEEANALDEWLDMSDDNLAIFEDLTNGLDDAVFSPNDLICDTDDLLDVWMIAGLIARQMENIITPDEKNP